MSRKARLRKEQANAKRKKGVMTGMRGGIKKVASVATEDEDPEKKSNLLNGLITVALVAAVAYFLWQRFG